MKKNEFQQILLTRNVPFIPVTEVIFPSHIVHIFANGNKMFFCITVKSVKIY
jgi:hypothetical protein